MPLGALPAMAALHAIYVFVQRKAFWIIPNHWSEVPFFFELLSSIQSLGNCLWFANYEAPAIGNVLLIRSLQKDFNKVLYMSSSFWLLRVESRDFSKAKKEKKNCLQSWANPQDDNHFHSKRLPRTILSENSCHFMNLLSFASSSFFLSFSAWEKWRDSTRNSQKLEDM